ncbi:MAG: histidine phosphatase family protein [Micropruina sp.]|nr:histidine phosphatase family protein [Micropruina sp.]
MKHLYLMRHARAAETSGGRGDHARPLTAGGIGQAKVAGRTLALAGVDLIVSSTAARALQTAQNLGLGVPLATSDDLYNAGSISVLGVIGLLPEDARVAVVVGHAPGIPALAHTLASDDSDPVAWKRVDGHFPPATLVGLEFEGTWAELEAARVFLSRHC